MISQMRLVDLTTLQICYIFGVDLPLTDFQNQVADTVRLTYKVYSLRAVTVHLLNKFKTDSGDYLLPWLHNNNF